MSAVAFSPDGKLLATGGQDKSVSVWRLDTGERRRFGLGPDFQADTVAYSPDGSRIAVTYSDGSLQVWEAHTGALDRCIVTQQPRLRSLQFSPDGAELWAGVHPTDAAWSTHTGALLRPGAANPDESASCGDYYREAVSPDGRMLAVASGWEGWIELRRRDTGEVLHRFCDPVDPDGVVSLAFSPDGQRLASGYVGFRVRLWDVKTGQLVQLMRTHEDSITSLAFSPDGEVLAVGGSYGTVVVLCNLRAETRPIRLVFTREERQMSEERTGFLDIPLEELPEEEEVSLEGHTGGIRGACFAPDGRKVATVAADGALKLWEVGTGRLLATLLPLPSTEAQPSKEWIAYTPDGEYLASPGAAPFLRRRVGNELQPIDALNERPGDGSAVAAALR